MPKEGFSLQDLEHSALVLEWDGKGFAWRDEVFQGCALEVDPPPPQPVLDRILERVGLGAREANRVEVPFEKIAPLEAEWWRADSVEGLRLPVGRAGAQKIQRLDLGEGTAQHALVVGKTGSGKSTLLHALITSLALTYSPQEAELYLIDFKKGVEFKPYATLELPHARVIAIESEREFGLSVLQGLTEELHRRGERFRAAGVDHIADYRRKTGQPLARILLVVDEFQEFFTEDDSLASQASQLLDRLVRQGRAFGLHVLLGSQTLGGTYSLARSTIDQMAVRIALQCSEADSRIILADDNPAARLLSRPGEAIYNAANGLVEGNNLFQVAWLPDAQRDGYLKRINTAAASGKDPIGPQVVFEGNAPGEPEKNQALATLLAALSWPSQSDNVAWVGEPIAIKEPTAVRFRRQSGSNLLIVGHNAEAAAAMVFVASISLAAQSRPQQARWYILNFAPPETPFAFLFSALPKLLPHTVRVGGRRELPQIMETLADEIKSRIAVESDRDGGSGSTGESFYVVVFGLQRARDLRQDDAMDFRGLEEEESTASTARQFATVLREGAEVGIHSIIWCDTYGNLSRTLDRRAVREFGMRVAFQMGAEDSVNLVDSGAASRLRPFQALLFTEETGQVEKFRPYGLPSSKWLETVQRSLRGRR
jgi:energy-coupling factor transporter ATP-binding protein EcfA2